MRTLPDQVPDDALVVSRESLEDDWTGATVFSLSTVVDLLLEAGLTPGEIQPVALQHYAVDNYVGQVFNGGHSQFLYNIGPRTWLLEHLEAGLRALCLPEAVALWAEVERRLDAMPAGGLRTFLAHRPLVDGFVPLAELSDLDHRFYQGLDHEIGDANAAVLRSRPELVALPEADIPAYVAARAARRHS